MSHAIAGGSVWNILLSQGNYGGFGPSSGDPLNPYASMGGSGMSQPPKRGSSVWMWVLGIGGGVLLVGLLCCGCIGGFMYFGVNQMHEQVKLQVQNDPVIREHIGDVQSVSTNFAASVEEIQANPPPPGDNVLTFDIKGSKGAGLLVGTQLKAPAQGKFLRNMKLKKDGQVYPLAD